MNTIDYAIQSVYPANGSENVPLDTTIQITFRESMNKASVEDPKRIMLTDYKGPVPARYSFNTIKRVLTITPNALEPGRLYRIKVNKLEDGPTTAFGHQLAQVYNYIFETTGEPESEEPEDTKEPESPEKDEATEDEELEDQLPTEDENDSEVIYDPFEPLPGSGDNTVRLMESFPESGDLVELDGQMVFIFNRPLNRKQLAKHIYLKEAKLNKLLEALNQDQLLSGALETSNGEDEDTTFIFRSNTILTPGKEYQVVIRKEADAGLAADIRITFHTLFERMFADVDTVRLVLGQFSERLTDLELAKLINQQSNSIYQLASMMDTFEEGDWVEDGGIIVSFPYAASQYVVYSTAYYAILGQSLETSSGMAESIRLADLSVSGSSDVADNLSDLLELLKAEYERWWSVLQGEAEEVDPEAPNPNYSMTFATRGGDSSPYPEFQTRVPFEELGGGGE